MESLDVTGRVHIGYLMPIITKGRKRRRPEVLRRRRILRRGSILAWRWCAILLLLRRIALGWIALRRVSLLPRRRTRRRSVLLVAHVWVRWILLVLRRVWGVLRRRIRRLRRIGRVALRRISLVVVCYIRQNGEAQKQLGFPSTHCLRMTCWNPIRGVRCSSWLLIGRSLYDDPAQKVNLSRSKRRGLAQIRGCADG